MHISISIKVKKAKVKWLLHCCALGLCLTEHLAKSLLFFPIIISFLCCFWPGSSNMIPFVMQAMHRPLSILIRNLHSVVYAMNVLAYWMKIQYMNLRACFFIFCVCACVNRWSCSLAPLPVRAGNQALKSCHGGTEWLSPDTDASRGWSCHHYELFRVTVTPSSTLEGMPRLRDLQSATRLGLTLQFNSAATVSVQASSPSASCY